MRKIYKILMESHRVNRWTNGDSSLILGIVVPLSEKPPLQNAIVFNGSASRIILLRNYAQKGEKNSYVFNIRDNLTSYGEQKVC